MAGGIFICYRRDDSRHAAGRLVDRLAQTFARDQLFLDIDAIEPGLDFLKVMHERLGNCDVMLTIMGPNWTDCRDAKGERRLDDPHDYVRLEVEAALHRDIRVIPVLVDGAQMPKHDDLPRPLRPLARRHAVRIDHERFGAEADQLASRLAEWVKPRRAKEGLEKIGEGVSGFFSGLLKPDAAGKDDKAPSTQPGETAKDEKKDDPNNWLNLVMLVIVGTMTAGGSLGQLAAGGSTGGSIGALVMFLLGISLIGIAIYKIITSRK